MPIVSADKFQYFQPSTGLSNIPHRMVVPGSPTIPSEPATGAARMILGVGDALEKMGKVIREAQVKDDVQRFTLGAMDELSRAEQEVSREGSHRDMPERFQGKLQEIGKRYQERIGQDPAVRAGFGEKFGLLAQHHVERVRTQSWRRELDQQQAGAIAAGSTALNLVGQARSMGEVRLHMQDYLDSLDYKAQNGLVDASWAAGQRVLFEGRVGGMLVEQDMLVDPGLTIEKLTREDLSDIYPGLGEEKRVDYLRIAKQQMEQRQSEALQLQARRERLEEKAHKDLLEKNYGDALVAYSQGQLTETMVQDLLSRRAIDPDKGASLLKDMRGEGRREENDPVVLGGLASDLELGRDITERLTLAQARGQVKTETFIALRKQQADQKFKRGLSYVGALKPSDADKWSPDKHVRYADAVDEYSSRVASGQDPLEVSQDIVGRYLDDVRRTARGILRPRFLEGDKGDISALEQAKEKTAQAFQAGKIDASEFAREAERLDLLSELALQRGANAEELSSEELKEREKKLRKQGKKQ